MNRLRLWRILLRLTWRADPARTAAVVVLAPLAGMATGAVALALKWLVDAVVRGDRAGALWTSAMVATAVVGMALLGTGTARLRLSLQHRVGHALDRHVMSLCTGIPTLARHEDPAFQDRLEVLRRNRSTITVAVTSLVENVRNGARLISIIGLLAAVDARLMALPLFAIPAVIAAGAGQRLQQRTDDAVAQPDRLRRSLFTLATTAGPAKELRVYRLAEQLTRRHDTLQQSVNNRQQATTVRIAGLDLAGATVFCLGVLGAVALVLTEAIRGAATVGDVVLLVSLASQIDGTVAMAAQAVHWFRRARWAGGHYLWLIDEAAAAAAAPRPHAPVPTGDLVLDRVAFAYPGGDARPVLRDVSLRIPAGSTIAVVGENGAGKSTLVKLLCRLYEPTSGRILLGGTDIRDVAIPDWRSILATGFQDFCRFELQVRENVGVGHLPEINHPAAVRAALRRAGAESFADALPHGLITQLGRTFAEGTDLSTGQWQKLAIARAMMRPEPRLLILDEPTASLDPAAEHALFTHYADAARRARAGTITIFVSHRFSTVRMADLIVVLDGGRIRQVGSHHELVAAAGPYAELYNLHSRGYRRAGA